MPIVFNWYNEDHDILITRYSGMWTWEEAGEIDRQIREVLSQGQSRVDSIIDARDNRWFPPQMARQIKTLAAEPYPNLELLVIVGDKFNYDVLAAVAQNYGDLPYRFVHAAGIPQALDIIRRDRNQQS